MITIYGPKETDFTHNGFGVVTAKDAVVTEELNGMFELEITCPAGDINKKVLPYFNNMYIIKADTPRGKQLFRIYCVKKNMRMEIQINARHITYDLQLALIDRLSGILSAHDAMNSILSKSYAFLPFSTSNNMVASSEVDFTDVNPITAILGEHGLTDLYSGELLRDNLNLSLKSSIGQDRGFFVRYRKNLTGLDTEENFDNVVTRVKPIGLNADGEALYLPEMFVESPMINDYFSPITRPLELRGIRAGTEDYPTEAEAFIEMRSQAEAVFQGGADLPKTNAKIDFVLLKNTAEYAEYAQLENVNLGDTVTAIFEPLDFNMKAQCIKYIYDCNLGRYRSIELGDLRDNFATGIGGEVSGLSNSSNQVPQLIKIWEMFSNHVHTGRDGTRQVDYNNLLNKPS